MCDARVRAAIRRAPEDRPKTPVQSAKRPKVHASAGGAASRSLTARTGEQQDVFSLADRLFPQQPEGDVSRRHTILTTCAARRAVQSERRPR